MGIFNAELRLAPIYIPAAPSTTTLAGIIATGAASTAAQQVIPSAAGYGALGVTQGWWDFTAYGADAFVIFGGADVAAATVNCAIFVAGVTQPYYCNGSRSFLRVITAGAAGTLRWVPSDR